MKGQRNRAAKSRLAAGVAAAGACALLAACSPVKMGSAAIVGNQRITSASLDSQVANLQQAATQYGSNVVQVPPAEMSKIVLGWLVSFKIRDRTASDAGITVNQSDVQAAITDLVQNAASQGASNASPGAVVAADGVPPDLATEFGRWFAQELAFIKKDSGGTIPSDQAAQQKAVTQLATADCKATKALNIQVNPQYGKLGFDSSSNLYGILAADDTLSRPAGKASPATNAGLPSC